MTHGFEDRLPIGRRLLWMVIVWSLLLSLGALGYTVKEMGPARIVRASIRFLLVVFLCYKVSLGRNWARLTMGILSALALIVAIVLLRAVVDSGSLPAILLASPYVLLTAFNVWALLYSRSVRDYLLWRRTHRIRSRQGEISQLVARLDRQRQDQTPSPPDDPS